MKILVYAFEIVLTETIEWKVVLLVIGIVMKLGGPV